MTTNIKVLTVEYDRDGDAVYAWVEAETGEIVRDIKRKSDLTKAERKYSYLIDSGRWDGETSGAIQGCHACHTGGAVERYANIPGVISSEGGWQVSHA